MSSDDGLAAFLAARLDEEAAAALEAADGDSGEWFMGDKWNVYRAEDIAPHEDTDEHDLVVYGNVKPQSEHIAIHDPARALREIEVRREIVNAYVFAKRRYGSRMTMSDLAEDRHQAGTVFGLLHAVQCIGVIWESHPDYREEWKP